MLEYWSDINNVFQFVRVEDIAYDKRPGMSNVVYIVDSGRGRRVTDTPVDTPFLSTNGRVWKMVFDKDDPTKVTSLTVLVEGDDDPVKTLNEIHQPDNVESTATGLLVTEDPGSSQQFAPTDTSASATTARLWYVPFSGTPQVVAKVNQSADGGPTDVGPLPTGERRSAIRARGSPPASSTPPRRSGLVYLIDVQAHTLWIEKAPGDDNNGNGQPDFTFKREGGQLLLLKIPGI